MGYKLKINGKTYKDLIINGKKHKAVYAGDKLIWEKRKVFLPEKDMCGIYMIGYGWTFRTESYFMIRNYEYGDDRDRHYYIEKMIACAAYAEKNENGIMPAGIVAKIQIRPIEVKNGKVKESAESIEKMIKQYPYYVILNESILVDEVKGTAPAYVHRHTYLEFDVNDVIYGEDNTAKILCINRHTIYDPYDATSDNWNEKSIEFTKGDVKIFDKKENALNWVRSQ